MFLVKLWKPHGRNSDPEGHGNEESLSSPRAVNTEKLIKDSLYICVDL
jgi:hypothetical protein